MQNNQKVGKVTLGRSGNPPPPVYDSYVRENATFFSLVRNSDFQGILSSIDSVEERFNKVYHYDWVFANDEPFTPAFIEHVTARVSGSAHFVHIPAQFWGYPPWIDLDKAERARKNMKENKIKYGASQSYRHMCRFNSGFFFHLPVMKNYKYYWRVEPDIAFKCDLFDTDWFRFMRINKKKYAFVLAPLELHMTVKNLWRSTKMFFSENPDLLHPDNSFSFLSDDNGDNYNMCHFWSNFELGDMDFFRSSAYTKFFEYLDQVGGFYYSRWGDAPVHTLAVTTLLSKDEVHYIPDTGYFHNPNGNCPRDDAIRRARRCSCSTRFEHTWSRGSCIPKWYEVNELEKPSYGIKFKNVHKFAENEDADEYDDW
ncbi:glycosyl transferase [Yamadazyma tenuis ATCC 10573]|uniref:Glycosyl transferase n=2 Tax=Candida tenuis TaxID=2315449 RepID=G3BB83_CANTC|nr:glycosyl transferase [Yamadazyma tenuis ATCC 10573]EGV61513.1 glycosyl transferase [Yamadazyma tenuis ATCC 10573]